MNAFDRWTRRCAAWLALACTVPAAAQGVYPPPEASPDLRFEVSGTVNAIVRYHDGSDTWYLVGGDFADVNGVARRNLARVRASDGSVDAAWSADTDGVVNALALSGDRLFVGGTFSEVDGAPRARLARVDADDGALAAWAPDANDAVNALQADATHVWAGGAFSAVEGVARSLVARLDADAGTVDTGFNASLTQGPVFALLLDEANGLLYVGGRGRLRGSQRALVRVASASGVQSSWNPGIGPQGGSRVRALAMDGTTVYAAGRIRRAANTNRGNGARFARSDAALQAWNPGADAEVLALAVDAGRSAVYVGGDFLDLGGHVRLARTDATSGAASATWSADADRRVASLLLDGDDVLVGGTFDTLAGAPAQGGLARLDADDAANDAAFVAEVTGPGVVSAFAMDAAGGVIVAGAFDGVRRTSDLTLHPRRNLARLLPAGDATPYGVDPAWTPDVLGEVFALAIDGNDLYLGGNFSQVQGAARTRLARLAADTGALDAGWSPTAGAPVRVLAATGGNVYVAGDFIDLSGTARAGLGRLAASGGSLDGWNPAPDDVVDAVLPTGEGIYVGGGFTSVGGAARLGLALLDDGGAAVTTFQADLDTSGAVHALADSAAGVLVGGRFSAVAGEARDGLARVAADGSVDPAFASAADGGTVRALAVDAAEGFVYFGGAFATAGGAVHPNLARAALGDGTVDAAWRPGTDGAVVQLGVPSAGQVLAAGLFQQVTGQAREGMARFGSDGSDATAIAIDSITPVGGTAGADSLYGQGYVVAWSVHDLDDPGTVPTGQVTVSASGGESCGPVPVQDGSCTLQAGGTGARTVVAAFAGDPAFMDSLSDAAPHTVLPAPVSLTLDTQPYPSDLGEAVVASVALAVAPPGGGTPGGAVVVTVDGAAGCTIVRPDTECTLPAFVDYGYYDIEATYTDDAVPARHVAAGPATRRHAVGTPTGLTLSLPANAVVGTPVTAQIASTELPDGAQVSIAGGDGCVATIAGDAGQCDITFDVAGTASVTAQYAGNAALLPAQDEAQVEVARIATSIALSALPAAPVIGQSVTLMAATTGLPDGAVLAVANAPGCASITIAAGGGYCSASFPAAGQVQVDASIAQTPQTEAASDSLLLDVGKIPTAFGLSLSDDTPVVGDSVVVSLAAPDLPADALVAVSGGSGCTIDRSVADSCSLSFAAAGAATLSGSFAETATHLASNASAGATVAPIATTLSLALAPVSPVVGQSATLMLTTNLPDGAVVTISDAPGCSQLVLPATQCSVAFAAAGSVSLGADFAGSPQHSAQSASLPVTVQPAATQFTAFGASPSTGEPGDSLTFTWSVGVTAPGQGTPGGNVRVSVNGDGSAPTCTVPVAAGTCDLAFPAEGVFSLQAEYLGDGDFAASQSAPVQVTIASAAPVDADLQIVKTVSRSRVDVGVEEVEYLIVVSNAGPAAVTAAAIADVLPVALSAAVWTCTEEDGGANCGAAGGNGNVATTADLAPGSSVSILVRADVDDPGFPGLFNTASVAAPPGQNDPAPGNNSSTAFYQTCLGNRGPALSPHVCQFKDGFEPPSN